VQSERYITGFCILGALLVSCWLPGVAQAQEASMNRNAVEEDTVFVRDPDLSKYFPSRRSLLFNPFPGRQSRLVRIPFQDDKTVRMLDSLSLKYTVSRTIKGLPVFYPVVYDFDSFTRLSKHNTVARNWNKLIQESNLRREAQRGLLDLRINIPGGERSAFSTIFGKNELNLQVRGTANMFVGASIQETDNPSLTETERRRVDPIFSQNLKLNIQGTIGDKLKIGTDWDSERMFDFENRLKLVYEGYDDEIIRTIEMGNVSMETGNSLIRGGSALFGIKTQLQLGALSVTSVISQNEGKGNSQTIKGGSTEATFDKKPADYEDRRHFLVDFFSFDNYEEALSNPTLRQQLYNFSRINVWVSSISVTESSLREAIALVDLGVDPNGGPPSQQRDVINNALLNQLRQGNDSDKESIANLLGVKSNDIFIGPFRQLTQGIEYQLDQTLGIISLRSALQDRQVLAISFEYTDPITGQRSVVGDLDQAGGRLILKMIRQPQVIRTDRTWDLTLRNTYSLDQSNLTTEGFKMDLLYTGGNNPTTNLPNVARPLLQLLGLDRVGVNGESGADNLVDFSTGTLDPINGIIRFPYLQPFGNRLRTILENNYSGADRDQVIERLVFADLYTQQQENARQSPKNNFYGINGTVQGGARDNYQLGAFGLVEGSVRVTVGGRTLQEGTDFQVDYAFGSVTITNRSYLSSGQEVNIEYESNELTSIQKKTFTGVRAQYDLSNNIKLGGTWFRLRERPITDKIRIGDEPVNNSVFGFDAKADFDVPWLTRAIDKIPLLQTKAPSSVSFSGEWAKLTPGLGETVAVGRERKQGNLFPDEERGLSFIDDFEGSKTNVSILNQARWNLSSAPIAIPGLDDMDNFNLNNLSQIERQRRNDYRGAFTWYMIPQNVTSILGLPRDSDEVRQVEVTELFDRDVLSQDRILTPLDLYFNPRERGPYNYNRDIATITANEPEKMWGGMTATILSGQQDFSINNIEFLEFWVQPIIPGGAGPADAQNYDGKLFIDIGTISEDVIPNFRLNTEDGLADNANLIVPDLDGRSYVLSTSIRFDGEFSTVNQEREDIGLDGAASSSNQPFNEQTLFAEYIQHMSQVYANDPTRLNAILSDPSNDDYVYYADDRIKGRFNRMQDYFLRYNGYMEGNTPRSNSNTVGNTNRPDSESLIVPGQVNLDDNYYQYEIPWNPGDPSSLSIGNSFIVDSVSVNERLKWYQVRIPLREFQRQVGNIANFQQISYIRFWMTGYREPLTMRFATFEFVGSQWRKAEEVGNQAASTDFKVQTINSEENSNRRPIPYRVPNGTVRPIIRTQQGDLEGNEQSLVLSVNDLRQGDIRMIRRNYTEGLNMINYSNLRMFVHGEGYENRSDVELVIRLGRDLENDYYEYRQPISPTDPRSDVLSDNLIESKDQEIIELIANEIWKYSENSMNIELSVFNQIKQLRTLRNAPFNTVFYDSVLIQNAVPGAIVGIKGNPSLEKITEIGIGISNPLDLDLNSGISRSRRGIPSLDAEVWVNEMRVSGFTDEGGWAARGNTSIIMADFATINGNLLRTTDGFGALDSRLGERDYADKVDYDVSATINLHKTIPDRFGFSFPVLLSARQSTSTPRFLPNEGDVRLNDFRNAINNDPLLTPDQKRVTIDQKVLESQTYSEAYSINFNSISKQYSRNPIMRLLVDNTRINYVYNKGFSRDPQNQFVDNWNYTTGIDYNLSVRNVRLARPLFFLDNIPVLNTFSGLRIGYMPSSVTASASLKRNYEERQRRAFSNEIIPLQQTHTFTYDSKFGINYNLTPSIPISFNTTSELGFNRLGEIQRSDDTTRYNLRPTMDVVRDILQKDAFPRRNNYNEQYSASWRPNTQSIRYLDWFSTTTSYRGGFTWTNSPEGSGLGARLSNTFSLDQTTTFQFRRLLQKIPLYENMVTAEMEFAQARESARTARRTAREAEKAAAREEREKIREEERAKQEAYETALTEWKELEKAAKEDTSIVVPPKPKSPKEIAKEEAEKKKEEERLKREEERKKEQEEKEKAKEGEVTEEAGEVGEGEVGEAGEGEAEGEEAAAAEVVVEAGNEELSLKEQIEGVANDTIPAVKEPREPSMFQKTLAQVGRKSILAVFSLESFDITYKHSTGSDQSGYAGGSQIWDSFGSDFDTQYSPQMGYRLGFDRSLPASQLIANTQQGNQSITLNGSENFKDDIIMKTKLSPFKNLTIDLDWSATWDEKQSINTTIQPDQMVNSIYNISGNIGASVWVFGPGFETLFKSQLQTAFDDIQATPAEQVGERLLADQNGDGRSMLNPSTLRDDFVKAYLSNANKTFGKRGLSPFPLPGWNISLGGLESRIPFAQRFVSRISLNHMYKGTYTLGWFYNTTADTLRGIVGVYNLLSQIPQYKPEQLNIEKRFSPLIGLSMTWKNGVSTTMSYETSSLVSLNLDNSQVMERTSKSMKFSSNFQKRGFRVPLVGSTLRNTLDLAFSATYSEDETNDNRLDQKLEANVLQREVENFDVDAYEILLDQPTGDTRVQFTANISYQFSATVKAGFEYRYNQVIPKSTATFRRLDQDFKFNIIVNIRSN